MPHTDESSISQKGILSTKFKKISVLIAALPIPIGLLIFILDMIGLGYAQGRNVGYGLHYNYSVPSEEELPIYTYIYLSNTLDVFIGALAIAITFFTVYMIAIIAAAYVIDKNKIFGYFELKAKQSYRRRRHLVQKKRDKVNVQKTITVIKNFSLIGAPPAIVLGSVYLSLMIPKYAYEKGEITSKLYLQDYAPCNDMKTNKERRLICTCVYSDEKLHASGYAIYKRDEVIPLFVGNGIIMQPIKGLLIKRTSKGEVCQATWSEAKMEILKKDKQVITEAATPKP